MQLANSWQEVQESLDEPPPDVFYEHHHHPVVVQPGRASRGLIRDLIKKTFPGAAKVERAMDVVADRTYRFARRYAQLYAAEERLPGLEDDLWKDGPRATLALQDFLKQSVPDLDRDEREGLSEKERGGLDAWQRACLHPLLRRREELVLAPPGTGKSFVAANIVQFFLVRILERSLEDGKAPPIERILVAVRDQSQVMDQLSKMTHESSFFRDALASVLSEEENARAVAGQGLPTHPYVASGVAPGRKPVTILTMVQLGNWIAREGMDGPKGVDQLERTLIIIDEIHELADPKDLNPTWKASVEVLNKALDARVQLPYEKRFLLVGMTASPPIDMPNELERLLRWFTPPGVTKPFSASELFSESGSTSPSMTSPRKERVEACALEVEGGAPATVARDRFLGVSVFVYASERNKRRFASWETAEPLVMLVPMTPKDTVKARKVWTQGAQNHFVRADRMGQMMARTSLQLLLTDLRKTLVMLDGERGCTSFVTELRRLAPKLRVEHLPNDVPIKQRNEIKEAFDKGEQSFVLVADRKKYGTGHSFWSPDDDKKVGRGARRIMYTPAITAGKLIQVEGRANRRGTHAGYSQSLRNVQRVLLVPIGQVLLGAFVDPKRKHLTDEHGLLLRKEALRTQLSREKNGLMSIRDPRVLTAAQDDRTATCESVKMQLNVLGLRAANSVYAALFYSGFAAKLLWNWRPRALDNAPRPPSLSEEQTRLDVARKIAKRAHKAWVTS